MSLEHPLDQLELRCRVGRVKRAAMAARSKEWRVIPAPSYLGPGGHPVRTPVLGREEVSVRFVFEVVLGPVVLRDDVELDVLAKELRQLRTGGSVETRRLRGVRLPSGTDDGATTSAVRALVKERATLCLALRSVKSM